MFKQLLLALLMTTQTFAGLPPTTVKGQSETSPVTTFNFQAPYNQATTTGSGTRVFESGNNNLLLNPSFEHTTPTTSWVQGSGTSCVVETGIVSEGKKSLLCTMTAVNGVSLSQDVTPTIKMQGMNFEYGVALATTSTTLQVCPRNAAATVGACTTVPSDNILRYYPSPNYAGPSSGSVGVSVITTGSTTGTYYVDEGYVGKSRNIGTVAQASFVGSLKYAGTVNCQWGSTSTSLAPFAADTDCPAASVTTGSGAVAAPGTKIPGIVVSNLAPGTYKVSARTSLVKTGTQDATFSVALNDGTTTGAAQVSYANTTNGSYQFPTTIVSYFTYTTSQSSVTYQVYGQTDNASNTINLATDKANRDFEIAVEYIPSSAQAVTRMDQSGWYVDATMDGGNPDLGLTSVTSYTEIVSSSMTLKPQTGSQPVGVMCSSTNAATAPSTSNTTCAAGSESTGINFTIPKPGAYEVCFYGGHFMSLDTSEAINAAFELNETPTNAQTLTLEGGTRMQSSLSGGSTSGVSNGVTHPMNTCSIFNWTSTGTKGVRLMFEQNVSGTPNQNLLLADADANVGQRNIRWTVKPWTEGSSQFLVGGVTSSSGGLMKIDYFRISTSGAICSASPCTVDETSASGIFSATRSSAGRYAFAIAAGTFSSKPKCWGGHTNSVTSICAIAADSATTGFANCNTAGGGAVDESIEIICMGPR